MVKRKVDAVHYAKHVISKNVAVTFHFLATIVGKILRKRNTSTTKRYEMVELTSIAAKVVLKNIKAIYRAKMYSMQSTSTQKNDEVLLTRVQAKRQKKQKLQCPNCDKAFYPTSARTVYCSRECADKAHSKRMREKQFTLQKWHELCKMVFRNASFNFRTRQNKCAVCETQNQIQKDNRSNLHIHHIDENPSNNYATNLITLCNSCHITHHKSNVTPFSQLQQLANDRTASMTYKWKEIVISLQTIYSSTTV